MEFNSTVHFLQIKPHMLPCLAKIGPALEKQGAGYKYWLLIACAKGLHKIKLMQKLAISGIGKTKLAFQQQGLWQWLHAKAGACHI